MSYLKAEPMGDEREFHIQSEGCMYTLDLKLNSLLVLVQQAIADSDVLVMYIKLNVAAVG